LTGYAPHIPIRSPRQALLLASGTLCFGHYWLEGSSRVEIARFWRACPLDKPPFVHPEDLPILRKYDPAVMKLPRENFRRFIFGFRFGDFDDHRFHLSLLPMPYVG
jgi:hypothetical protein